MQALEDNGKDVDKHRDADGASALMLAAAKVCTLVSAARAFFGATPHARMVRRAAPGTPQGHANKVKLLLAAGADVTAKDKMGRTALWYAGMAPRS